MRSTYAEGGFSFATLADLQHAAGTIVKTNNAGLLLAFGAATSSRSHN
jgi:hypothetical protein